MISRVRYLLPAGTTIERLPTGWEDRNVEFEFESFVTTKNAYYEEGDLKRSVKSECTCIHMPSTTKIDFIRVRVADLIELH
jgi:hypothetical protein